MVHQDRWLSVRADDCRTAEGLAVAPYYVLEYPDWVNVVAVTREDQLVLVHQYRHALGAVSTELPAGSMDPGESDPLVTAARELREETGYVSGDLRIVARLAPNPATHANSIHVVLARNATFAGAAAPDPTEDIRVQLVPRAAVTAIALGGEMVHAMHISSLLIGLSALHRLS